LATINHEGFPKQRAMSLTTTAEHTFVFHTLLDSDKIRHIKENNHVSLFFLWENDGKIAEISIAGTVKEAGSIHKKFKDLEPYELHPSNFSFTITKSDIKDQNPQKNVSVQYVSYEKDNGTWKKTNVKKMSRCDSSLKKCPL
jgi:hypothetical protein